MATLYTVCADDEAIQVSLTMTLYHELAPVWYYDYWGCSVEEYRALYYINASAPSDNDYTINVKLRKVSEQDNVEYYDSGLPLTNGIYLYLPDGTGKPVMPAGATQIVIEVLLEQYITCGDDDGSQQLLQDPI